MGNYRKTLENMGNFRKIMENMGNYRKFLGSNETMKSFGNKGNQRNFWIPMKKFLRKIVIILFNFIERL